jgi:hypothetical protein
VRAQAPDQEHAVALFHNYADADAGILWHSRSFDALRIPWFVFRS